MVDMDPHGGLITGDLVDWLNTMGFDFEVHEGPKVPDLPERVCVLTRTGGPGLYLGDGFDRIVFQTKCRGETSDPSRSTNRDAERMSWQIDAALLGADAPTIGGVPTLGFVRTGSPPTPDEDTGDRVTMSCNYGVSAASVLNQ